MATRTGWLGVLLTGAMLLAPTPGWSQETYEVPPADPALPLPLYHDHPEKGGFFTAADFIFWRQTNPIREQTVAIRGVLDVDGSLQVARNVLFPQVTDPITGAITPAPAPVNGKFFGSGMTALSTEQVGGPGSYEPGLDLTVGWRFQDGFALLFTWRHLTETKYNAVASVIPSTFNIGRNGEDQFLFSPVYNFPPEFAGPPNKLAVANPAASSSGGSFTVTPTTFITVTSGGVTAVIPSGATVVVTAATNGSIAVPQAAYGIWNAATVMSLSFVQRNDQYDLVGRMPIFQDDCMRWYATAGARNVHIWERFQWRTVSVETVNAAAGVSVTGPTVTGGTVTVTGANGTVTTTPLIITGGTISTAGGATLAAPAIAGPDDAAIYTNLVSNELYGPTIGCGTECYIGHGFSASLDLRASAFIDVVKEYAKYERQDRYIANKRTIRDYTIVPELSAEANLWWYPIEGVEMRLGYDVMTFFNTVASPNPVDFNYGAVAPAYEKGIFRIIDGFHAGVGIIF